MGHRRYLLTLMLAASAGALIQALFLELPNVVFALGAADSKSVVEGLDLAIFAFFGRFLALFVLGYLLWRVVSFLYLRPEEHAKPLVNYLLAGLIVVVLAIVGPGLLVTLTAMAELGSYAWGPILRSILNLQVVAVIIAGLVWGAIFWDKDPRSSKYAARFVEEF